MFSLLFILFTSLVLSQIIWSLHLLVFIHLFIYYFYPHLRACLLILDRREGREKEGKKHRCEREIPISCLSYAPWMGPHLKSRHVPWPGVKPATFRFTEQCSNRLSHTSHGLSLFLTKAFKIITFSSAEEHFICVTLIFEPWVISTSEFLKCSNMWKSSSYLFISGCSGNHTLIIKYGVHNLHLLKFAETYFVLTT